MKENFRQLKYLFFIVTLLVSVQCSRTISKQASGSLNAEGAELYEEIYGSNLPWTVWSKSVEDRDILLLEIGKGENVTLIMGGFHGNERLGAKLVYTFAKYLYDEKMTFGNEKIVIVPVVNPDGLLLGTRYNKNGIDLNRNFPTKNWEPTDGPGNNHSERCAASEPETKAVMKLLEKYNPKRIISIHTPLEVVNYDGPAKEIADSMAKFNGYPVKGYIGYPTPGSFGTYAGIERNIPVVTLELPRDNFKKVWQLNREALLVSLRY